jgi:hypothetical protein
MVAGSAFGVARTTMLALGYAEVHSQWVRNKLRSRCKSRSVASLRRLLLLLVAPAVLAAAATYNKTTIFSVTTRASLPSATDPATSMTMAVRGGNNNGSRGATSGATELMKLSAGNTTTARDKTMSAASTSPSLNGRWYSPVSAFNQPIPPGTPYRPNDASLISAFVNVAGEPLGPNLSSTAVYFADADTPTVTVHDNYPVCDSGTFQVPIPRGAKTPSELNPNNREPTMVVMQRRTGIEWSMFKITAPGETPLSSGGPRCRRNGDWNATIVAKFDPASGEGGWQGLANEACCPGSASRIYYPAGLVRPRDVRSRAPTWGHALSMTYGGVLSAFVYPAKSHGGFCTDVNSCVPDGARFQLDPRFDCTGTRLLVYTWERQACRTMQVYGMIVKDTQCIWPCRGIGYDTVNSYSVRLPMARYVDGGGSYRFPFDRADRYRRMPVEILRRFHVIDWTKWTGTPTLVGTVGRSGSVSLRNDGRQSVVRLTAGNYVITVRDRSRAYGFRLIGPHRRVLRASAKTYVGTLRWRVKLVRGIYRYSSGASSAASRAMFTVT